MYSNWSQVSTAQATVYTDSSLTTNYGSDGTNVYYKVDNGNNIIQIGAGGVASGYTAPPSPSPSPSITPSPSATPSTTPSISVSPTVTPSISVSPSITPSNTPTPSITPSNTPTPSITPSVSITPTVTPTATPTPSAYFSTTVSGTMQGTTSEAKGYNITLSSTSYSGPSQPIRLRTSPSVLSDSKTISARTGDTITLTITRTTPDATVDGTAQITVSKTAGLGTVSPSGTQTYSNGTTISSFVWTVSNINSSTAISVLIDEDDTN